MKPRSAIYEIRLIISTLRRNDKVLLKTCTCIWKKMLPPDSLPLRNGDIIVVIIFLEACTH